MTKEQRIRDLISAAVSSDSDCTVEEQLETLIAEPVRRGEFTSAEA